jgi:hypothetical protein
MRKIACGIYSIETSTLLTKLGEVGAVQLLPVLIYQANRFIEFYY